MTDTAVPFRILPRLDDRNRGFWTSGADGELRFLRCEDCGYYNHPPTPLCPRCHSKRQSYATVSGRATLHTFTVNHQPWMPGPELPYVIAIVEFPEQEGLRLTTNLVNCAIVLNVELDDVLQDDWRTWLKLGDPMTPFRKALIGRARAAAKTTDTS